MSPLDTLDDRHCPSCEDAAFGRALGRVLSWQPPPYRTPIRLPWWHVSAETVWSAVILLVTAVLVVGALAVGQARQAAACERYAGTATPCGSGLVQE